jgi:hypothetical protein
MVDAALLTPQPLLKLIPVLSEVVEQAGKSRFLRPGPPRGKLARKTRNCSQVICKQVTSTPVVSGVREVRQCFILEKQNCLLCQLGTLNRQREHSLLVAAGES